MTEGDIKPTAQGSFSQKPFAHILVFLLDKEMNGTLEVTHGDSIVSVYFREGAATKVQTSVDKRGLGQVMMELGYITLEQLDACNAKIAKVGGLQGQTLVELGAIDVTKLIRGLKEQMLLKLVDIFAMTDGKYSFYKGINKLSGFGPDEVFPIHTFPVLMAGLRTHGDKIDMSPLLRPLANKWLTLHDDIDIIRGFRLNREEKAIVGALLSGPRSFTEIAESGAFDNRVGRYVVYTMLITRQLIIKKTGPSKPPDDYLPPVLSSIPPPPRSTLDPELEARREGILEKAKVLAGQNYYQMLEIATDASIEDARRAYFKLSKRFHPDRIPPVLRSELKETVLYIFSNLKEAHSVLTHPPSREAYDEAMAGSPELSMRTKMKNENEVRDALEAEALFQRAIVFLKQNRLEKTAELLEEARILNPTEGEYLALETHLKVLKRPAGTNLDDLVGKLRRAWEDRQRSEQVTYFLADALKRSGKLNEARLYYRKTLEINEHNIEAARELRLLDRQKPQDKKGSGILRRFFK